MDNVGTYRKTTLTRMVLFTGDNFEEVRTFCRDTAYYIRSADPSDPEDADEMVLTPWGFADVGRFGHDGGDYRSEGLPPCPADGGYEGSGGYRAGRPDGAVFDYLHGRWIPLWAGDFVATGPKGEHYPVEAKVHAATYERVSA